MYSTSNLSGHRLSSVTGEHPQSSIFGQKSITGGETHQPPVSGIAILSVPIGVTHLQSIYDLMQNGSMLFFEFLIFFLLSNSFTQRFLS
jgi:hypothetical protein